jgi:hypothetical protein
VVVVLILMARIKPGTTAIAYGTSSGILYGAMAGLIKSVLAVGGSGGVSAALTDWETYALVIVALSAMGTQQVALGAGHLSTAMSAIIVSTPVASTAIAITIFDERFLATGFALFALFASVVVSFIGVFSLPREALSLGAPEDVPSPDPSDEEATASTADDSGFAHGVPGPNPVTLPVIPAGTGAGDSTESATSRSSTISGGKS